MTYLDRSKVTAVRGYRKGALTLAEVERLMKDAERFSRRQDPKDGR